MFSRFFGGESKEAKDQAALASATESIQKKLAGTIAGEGVAEGRFKQDAFATPDMINDVLKGLQDGGLDINSDSVQASAVEQISAMALNQDGESRSYDAAPGDTRGSRTVETAFGAGSSRELDAANQENTGEEARRRQEADEQRSRDIQHRQDTAAVAQESAARKEEDLKRADDIKRTGTFG